MAVYTYETKFRLINPVNDIEAARDYLTEDDMAEYLRNDIKYNANKCEDYGLYPFDIISIEWDLETEQSGKIVLKTKNEMSPQALEYISDWVRGQNSDGLGEGFEQQDFAEICDVDEWGDKDWDTCEMASFDWETNNYMFKLVSTNESTILEASDFTHLFKIGQKVRVNSDDFDSNPSKFYKGTVKEIYPDHIIVDVPEISDHMWYDKDNMGNVYPEYNFTEGLKINEEEKLQNSVLSLKFSIDPSPEKSAFKETKKWLESLDISDWTRDIKIWDLKDIKAAKIVMVSPSGFNFNIYTNVDLYSVEEYMLKNLEYAAEIYVFNYIEPKYQLQPFGVISQKREITSKSQFQTIQNESKKRVNGKNKVFSSKAIKYIRENRKGFKNRNRVFEADSYTEVNPLKIDAPRGEYFVWVSGDEIYGSAQKPDPTKNIVDARATTNFTSQGFDTIDEVIDYVKKYF